MLKKVLLLTVASVVSVSAVAGGVSKAPAANEGHVYVGAQVGAALHYKKNEKASVAGAPSYTSKNEQNWAGRVFAGYMFDQNFGVELGAATLGSQTINYTNSDATTFGIKTSMPIVLDADLVGQIALTPEFFAFAKAGVAAAQIKSKSGQTIVEVIGTPTPSVKHTSWSFMPRAELGLGYNLTQNVAVTASYAQYFAVGSYNSSHVVKMNKDGVYYTTKVPSFGMASVGLTYSF